MSRGTRGMPRAQRETRILDAAVEEFGRSAYAGATVLSIASAADVSKPLVLQYFGSKEDLFIACVTRAGTNLSARIDAVLAAGEPTLTLAADTLAAIFIALENRPHDWTILHDRTVDRGSAAHLAARVQRNVISAQAGRGVLALMAAAPGPVEVDDAAVLSEIWIGIVTSMVQWWLRHPDQTATQMTDRSYRIIQTVTRLAAASNASRTRTP
ncbi:TetR/AcrR family transcriptional regulator [Gordonia liuliyuniae]|uniref:TetR/AcrR family transcriptional regulator n=1 Tax=Gordonia liuliyuniae TaxID=2911517 RepID=A0ABS9IX25_9ACTN|nr:TetR/AcrR family transcriptional regulator [Gordonia liuliyuniae]MCF8590035.1 TetR/AcrR family transcriptional regulator [Gordonia liuliyuniae]